MNNKITQSKTQHRIQKFYLVALVAVVGVACLAVFYIFRADSFQTSGATFADNSKAFTGGQFEASGVTYVPGTSSILFVDDGKPGEVQWMELDEQGNQLGAIKAVSLGVSIEDLEGITTDGTYFYVVGSESRAKSSNQNGLLRFKFDPRTERVEAAEPISELKKLLIEKVAELQGLENRKAKDDGLNIEGLAWDAERGRLLLGLRSPIVDGQALAVSLKLRDPQGAFSRDNLEVEAKAIRIPLNGMGIRSIEYDNRLKLFRIISGASESQDKTDFKLWNWTGDQTPPREVSVLGKKLKPEGVARATIGNSDFTIIVADTSRYFRMD
jgi:hypothetical protein